MPGDRAHAGVEQPQLDVPTGEHAVTDDGAPVAEHVAMNDMADKPGPSVLPSTADDATEILIWFIQYVMKSRFVRQSESLAEWVRAAFDDIFDRGFFFFLKKKKLFIFPLLF